MKSCIITVAVVVEIPDEIDPESLALSIPTGMKVQYLRKGAFVHEDLPGSRVLSYESETVQELED